MVLIGEYLKEIRIKRKKNLINISKELNISISYLQAIENDEYSKIPGGAYTIGFIRIYANYLNLDSNLIINEYKEQKSLLETSAPIVLPRPIEAFHSQHISKIISVSIIVFISTGFYFMFVNKPTFQPEYAITSDIPEGLETIIEKYEIETALSKIQEINKEKISNNNIAEFELLKENEQKIQNNQITAFASRPDNSSSDDLKNLISLKIINSTWVQVRNKNDEIVYSKLLNIDDIYSYSLNDDFTITTGNAGNIIVSIGGEVMGKLGKKGEVLDSASITPEFFSN